MSRLVTFLTLLLFLTSCETDNTVETAERPPKKLFVFIDGTWADQQRGSNVVKLYEAVSLSEAVDAEDTFYVSGLGTEVGFINKYREGILGANFEERLLRGYRFLADSYQDGDEIYLFGWSRGARQSHVLADMLNMVGIPKYRSGPMSKAKSEELYNAFTEYSKQRKLDEKVLNREEFQRIPDDNRNFQSVPIKVLCLFDCVETAFHNFDFGRDETDPYKVSEKLRYCVPENVEMALHAIAADEFREPFEVQTWGTRYSNITGQIAPKIESQRIEEVWFSGDHSDIGGTAASQQSLLWVVEELLPTGILPADLSGLFPNPVGQKPINDPREVSGSKWTSINWREEGYPRGERFWAFYNQSGKSKASEKHFKKPNLHFSVIDRMKLDPVRSDTPHSDLYSNSPLPVESVRGAANNFRSLYRPLILGVKGPPQNDFEGLEDHRFDVYDRGPAGNLNGYQVVDFDQERLQKIVEITSINVEELSKRGVNFDPEFEERYRSFFGLKSSN